MASAHIVNGFSKLTRQEKLDWLRTQASLSDRALSAINSHLHSNPGVQEIYNDISENPVSNFFLPFGLAPNFLINDDLMTLPMVIEESSVVAAASHAAKFWAMHGGFQTEVRGMLKVGQIHFTWTGPAEKLLGLFETSKEKLLRSVEHLTLRMQQRGGGIESMEIRRNSTYLPGAFQIFVKFRTADAMGANFINSVLEALSHSFKNMVDSSLSGGRMEIIMSILSNFTPECLVVCHVESHPDAFDRLSQGMTGREFAEKFTRAVEIARYDPYRAVTHNKGIFNGMDAVIMATGNDYRAVEACGHAYASSQGEYTSLTRARCTEKVFSLTLEVPLALGTVGGLTSIHPMAATAIEILGHPDAEKLMSVVAAAGLASNFSAIRSLITTGIQQGHMKMHLGNILRQLKATAEEASEVRKAFSGNTVTFAGVSEFLESFRNQKS